MELTLAMLKATISGIGSVVSPIPRLITLAFGYFLMCRSSRTEICNAVSFTVESLLKNLQITYLKR